MIKSKTQGNCSRFFPPLLAYAVVIGIGLVFIIIIIALLVESI